MSVKGAPRKPGRDPPALILSSEPPVARREYIGRSARVRESFEGGSRTRTSVRSCSEVLDAAGSLGHLLGHQGRRNEEHAWQGFRAYWETVDFEARRRAIHHDPFYLFAEHPMRPAERQRLSPRLERRSGRYAIRLDC